MSVEPMQLAALLLEKKAEELSEGEAEKSRSSEATREPVTGRATRHEIPSGASGNRTARASSVGGARELGRGLASGIIAARRTSSARRKPLPHHKRP